MIYVTLAAYNEEKNIGALIDAVAAMSAKSGVKSAIVVVNDGSKDKTRDVIESRRGKIRIELIDQPNAGFLKALTRALQKTAEIANEEDVCVTMDADNTHSPELIPQLLVKIGAGADVVIASRFERGGKMIGVPFHRVVLSEGAKLVMSLLVPVKNVRDYSTAYRAYRVKLLREAFHAYPDNLLEGKGFSGMAGFLIRLSKLTPRIAEVPFVLRYDLKEGASSMNIGKTFEGYLALIAGYWTGKYNPRGR